MTTQEFVKQEVEKELNGFPNGLVNLPQIGLAFSDGLTKGLDIAEGFYEFVQDFTLQELAEKTTSELLSIYLTEINEKK